MGCVYLTSISLATGKDMQEAVVLTYEAGPLTSQVAACGQHTFLFTTCLTIVFPLEVQPGTLTFALLEIIRDKIKGYGVGVQGEKVSVV